MTEPTTTSVQSYLDRLQRGDLSAREDLFRITSERLERLTRSMLRDYPSVRRWEETADVQQNAMLRLWRAIEQVRPATARDFYRLAALQIRRELLDLARHFTGPQGAGARHASAAPEGEGNAAGLPDPGDGSLDPARLALWTELHQQAEALPEELREVFDLLWYQGLTQEEAAAMIGVTARTVKTRWRDVRLRLCQALGGQLPGV